MKNVLRELLLRLGRVFGIVQPTPFPMVASIDEARAKFMKAYDDQDYPTLCDILHENAKFRGSVYPERWTFTRDRIITDRYMSTETCTAIKAGATATPRENTRSVGCMTLRLTSDGVTPIGTNYAIDRGTFMMSVKPGHAATPTAGPYVILWRKEGGDWEMIHMDMQP
jgi:hypothetical protein